MFWLVGGWLVLGLVGSVLMFIADRVSAPSAPKWLGEKSRVAHFAVGLIFGLLTFVLGIAGLADSLLARQNRCRLRNS